MSDLRAWLSSIGLGEYAESFEAEAIQLEDLPNLSEDDLKELGLPMGPRKRLLRALPELLKDAGTEDEARSSGLPPDRSPRSYTPGYLAERILSARSALEGERKQVTVLFADIKGSTELVEQLDAEAAHDFLLPLLRRMMDAVHRFEGTVNKVQGDGLMAIFGAPLAHEDHAVRACCAALAMQEAMRSGADQERRDQTQPHIRVGLHSGEVVVRTIENDLSMTYDAIGMTVHVAARMEQTAPPGAVYLTAETLRLAAGFIDAESKGQVAVKGVSAPMLVYELHGITTRSRWQTSLARGLSRFVGREAALLSLGGAAERAATGRGQLVALVGEAGVGKSRLVYEFARSPAVRAWQVLAGSSVSYGRATTWLPVVDLLKDYFAIDDGDDAASRGGKVREKLDRLDPALAAEAAPLLALFDLDVDEPAWQALGTAQRRRRTLDAVQRLLTRESERQPLLLIFEDLHWIDGETQALLDELVDRLPSQRLLLLVDYRPEYRHAWSNRSHYLQLRLDPLAQPDVDALLASLLGVDASLSALKSMLRARTVGNPLFVEECVRALVEIGTLQGEPGAYRLLRQPDDLVLPATVQALIASRIDRLDPANKRLLQTAALIGTNVPLALLQAVADEPEERLQQGLGALQAAEFVYPGQLFPETEYRFKHAHTHEVASVGLLKEQRVMLHARVAEAMAALYPERRTELAEKLAEHYEQGEVWDRAVEHYLLAAQKGKAKYTYPSAYAYAQRAADLAGKVGGHDGSRVTALSLLGDLAGLMGELDTANEHYDQAFSLTADPERQRDIVERMHRRRFTERDGARIAFYEHGSGDETLVMVYPVAYSISMTQPLVEALCHEFRIVTIDPRGTGASDPVPLGYRFRDRVEDVHAVLVELGDEPVTGIGISQGCAMLARLNQQHPKCIRRLVFVGPSPGDPKSPFFYYNARDGRAQQAARYDQEILAGDFTHFPDNMKIFVEDLFSEPESRDLAQSYLKELLSLPQDVYTNFIRLDPDRKLESYLDAINCPVLITHGTADRMAPFAYAQYLSRRIHTGWFHPFEGKGHRPEQTATREFCQVLRQFMRSRAVPEQEDATQGGQQ